MICSRPSATARRLVRPAVAAVLVLLTLVTMLLAAPAGAAGTGGVDVSPVPGVDKGGRPITAFRATVPSSGDVTVRYALRNTTQAPATATVFAASATRNAQGGFSIGGAGSSPYVDFPRTDVTLPAGAVQLKTFAAHAHDGKRPAKNTYAAIVVEVERGSVVTRAATIVVLQPGRQVPLPLVVVVIAVALLALVGIALLLVRRRSGRSPGRTAAPGRYEQTS